MNPVAAMSAHAGVATGLQPPYFAVIFTSRRSDGDNGYGAASDAMVELAARQPGFLGIESARGADGVGITVSYWSSEEAIAGWRRDAAIFMRPGRERMVDEMVGYYLDTRLRAAADERRHYCRPLHA